MRLKKNDQVVVLAGKESGKKGLVVQVIPTKDAVVVEGVGIVKRHTKPSNAHPKGGILELTKPILAGKVALVCPHCKKPTRIGYELTKAGKVRICKKCKEVLK